MPTWITEGYPFFATWLIIFFLDFTWTAISLIFTGKNSVEALRELQLDIRTATRVILVLWILQSVERTMF